MVKKDKLAKDRPMRIGAPPSLDEYPMPQANIPKSLGADKCRWRVDPKSLPFKTTEEVKPLRAIVAQPRALSALKLGAEIRGRGYNVFVSGLSATGRSTAVKSILDGLRLKGAPTKDRCYVNNFKAPDEPRLITLPRGKGEKFRKEVASTVDTLKRTVPHALEDETILARKREVAETYAKKEADLYKELETKVSKDGFALVQVQMGPYTRPDVFPIIDGNPVPPNQVGELVEQGKFPKEKLEDLYRRYQGYKADLRAILKQVRDLSRELAEKSAAIEKEVLEDVLREFCDDLCERFPYPGMEEYLHEIRDFIITNPEIFGQDDSSQPRPPVSMPIPGLFPSEDMRTDPFRVFQVNVVRNAAQEDPTPVIIEHHPTHLNLFGTIERETRFGGYTTSDFTNIRGGSFLRADGGYLVLNVVDVLMEPLAWRTLIRTLKTGKLQVQGLDTLLSLTASTLKPQPIDIDVTVILIGEAEHYHLLSFYEEDFGRIFKIRADFDSLMPRGKTEIGYYAALASKKVAEDGQKHLTAKAVARLAEQGARLTGRGKKLSARFGEIADLLTEANHFAGLADSKFIESEHIDKAVAEAEYRQDLIRERVEEAMADDIIMVETKGSAKGQVNGLAVHDLGTFAFGRPQKITCEISMGEAGVVNIEREAKLSGRVHDKAVLIMEGFFRHMYGMDGPITLSASLCFEQSYGMIEGDSATLAEILVLLSELGNCPLRQDLAVTGSVNQKGQVQPIGGVNEKIEGFYRVCRQAEFTGTQGVVIPKSNVSDLMLNDDVLAAIAAGTFHIYPVATVDEAVEIFTGVVAGKRLKKGGFTKGSVHDRVDYTLADFYWATRIGAEKEQPPQVEEAKPVQPRRGRKGRNGPQVPKDPRDQQKPPRKSRGSKSK
jgi:ATP-dependent Lon protease